nr:immunoglobulin heavy chain junction region [Mus musculus]
YYCALYYGYEAWFA